MTDPNLRTSALSPSVFIVDDGRTRIAVTVGDPQRPDNPTPINVNVTSDHGHVLAVYLDAASALKLYDALGLALGEVKADPLTWADLQVVQP